MKRLRMIIIMIAVLFLVTGAVFFLFSYSAGEPTEEVQNPTGEESGGSRELPGQGSDPATLSADGFELTMLDVGQGLCILVRSGDQYLLYDGGGRTSSSYVVSYLKQHGVKEVEYLFASHFDEDHIAGLIGVLKTTPVKTAVIPSYEADTAIYHSFMEAVTQSDTMKKAHEGDTYNLSGLKVEVLYACTGAEENENDRSTVIRLSKGDFSAILTGDAEKATETYLVEKNLTEKPTEEKHDLGSTLYVVGHHGSDTSSTEDFVKAVHPRAAFISVGRDNEYGHPTENVLQTLEANGASVYRTDLQGEVRFLCSANDYEVITEIDEAKTDETNSGDTKSREAKGDEKDSSMTGTSERETADFTYILNTSSHKIHKPDCEAVGKMAEHNKEYTTKNKEELIREGYAPCGLCNP